MERAPTSSAPRDRTTAAGPGWRKNKRYDKAISLPAGPAALATHIHLRVRQPTPAVSYHRSLGTAIRPVEMPAEGRRGLHDGAGAQAPATVMVFPGGCPYTERHLDMDNPPPTNPGMRR